MAAYSELVCRKNVLGNIGVFRQSEMKPTLQLIQSYGREGALHIVRDVIAHLEHLRDIQLFAKDLGSPVYKQDFLLQIANALACERDLATRLARGAYKTAAYVTAMAAAA